MDNKNTSEKMPDELRRQVELLTPMQRKYCEYRAKGLKQYQAAERAGSTAKTKESKGRVGYNMEQEPGAEDYINWLQDLRARQACVDDIEVIEKIRQVYDEAMEAKRFGDANNAAKMLGDMIGAFSNKTIHKEVVSTDGPKNDVSAFKESGETVEERAKKLRALIKDVNT